MAHGDDADRGCGCAFKVVTDCAGEKRNAVSKLNKLKTTRT